MSLRSIAIVCMTSMLAITALGFASGQLPFPRLMVIKRDAGIGILLIIPRSSAPAPGQSSDDTNDAGFDSGKLGEVEA